MRVSGFTFVRNAIKLYYPVVESITSILPICDEFIVAAGDSDDGTTELIRSINSDKIKIIETVWDPKYFVRGAINAQQTNIALDACTGDWAFYLQADEVVHQKHLPIITRKMERYLNTPEVEGLLFGYKHFYGDYWHYQKVHGWYRYEIRVVRTGIGVRSWKSAQSFRRDEKKLKVAPADAEIYHYGWVRPPDRMKQKQIALDSLHHPREWIELHHPDKTAEFDYGSLKHFALFQETHPQVMQNRIAQMDWRVKGDSKSNIKHKHNTLRIRILSFIENRILKTSVWERKNYILLRNP